MDPLVLLESSSSLPDACKLSVIHQRSNSIGDGSRDGNTPTSTTSGSSTPSRLRRAFLAAASGTKTPTSASVGAWDQIMKQSRQQHKKICYMLLIAIVVLAAVGAGGIAAGAKAKAEHQRGIDAAAAARAAQKAAAAAAAAPMEEYADPGAIADSNRLKFGVTQSVTTSEPQQQACSNWFSSQERIRQYQDLFMAGYSQALGIPQIDMTLDNIQCSGSAIPIDNSSSSDITDSSSSSSSSGSRRKLKQSSATVNVTTVFSVPQPTTAENSQELVEYVITESNSIIGTSLSSFFNARTQVVVVEQISSDSTTASPSPAAATVPTTTTTTKQEIPSSIPTTRTTYSSSAAATDLFQAGGQAAAAAGAAPVTPSTAAAGAHHTNAQVQIPLVVVDHDGTVIINDVLLPETAAVNATQMQEFANALESDGGLNDDLLTIEIQLPPELAAQHMSDMPDNVIPVTQAAFTAVGKPPVSGLVPSASAEVPDGSVSTPADAAEVIQNPAAAVQQVPQAVQDVVAAKPAAAAPVQESVAASDAAVMEETAIVSTPGVDATAASSGVDSSTPAAAEAASADAVAAAPAATETDAGVIEPLEAVLPNPSTPVIEEFTVIPEDTGSNPATTTFFPEVVATDEPAAPVQAPVVAIEAPIQVVSEPAVEPEVQTAPQAPVYNADGSPTQEQLKAYDWGSVLLETFDTTSICPFMALDSNIMADALGRLWSLHNGKTCTFKAANPARLRADPSGTNGAPLPTWETAVDCGEAPTALNSVRDISGHVWGYKNGASCAFRNALTGPDAAGAAAQHGPRMDTVWEVAPVCTAAPMKFTATADVFGRLWGVADDGRSCAFKFLP